VTFGGGIGLGYLPTSNEVWVLSLDGAPRWQRLAPAGIAPDPRQQHCAVYDPARDRMLVFGGVSTPGPPYTTYENSVWELSLGDTPAWRQISASGPAPSPRVGASMVVDAARDRVLVFGGDGAITPTYTTRRNDVFALTLGDVPTWRALAPTGTPPPPRAGQAAVMDAARDRLLVFGGSGEGALPLADAWALDLSVDPPAWKKAGPNASFPRLDAGAVLDPVTDRLVVDGGFSDQGCVYHVNETIALSLAGAASWRRLDDGPPSSPARRTAPVPLVDPLKRELIVEGGYDPVTFGFYDTYAHILSPADLWTWPLDSASPTWTTVRTSGPVPFLDLGRAVLDPVRRLQIRFFQDPPNIAFGASVGVLSLDEPGVWAPLVVSGSGPDPRQEFSTAYDPVRDRILLTGGNTRDPRGYSYFYHHDIWSLSLAGTPAWTKLRDDDPGGLVVNPDAFFYDPQADQFVAVGYGEHSATAVWALAADGSSPWRTLAPAPEGYAGVSFDPATRELVAIDFSEGEAYHLVLSDDGLWSALDASGTPPPARIGSRLEFDPVGRRVLCFGGQSAGYDPASSATCGRSSWIAPRRRSSRPGPMRSGLSWGSNLARRYGCLARAAGGRSRLGGDRGDARGRRRRHGLRGSRRVAGPRSRLSPEARRLGAAG
jgi:hypothetical protein